MTPKWILIILNQPMGNRNWEVKKSDVCVAGVSGTEPVASYCVTIVVQFARGVGWAIAAGLTCSTLPRKVRASQDAVVGNAHRSQEPGQCHRK